jgi:hypothetical protein
MLNGWYLKIIQLLWVVLHLLLWTVIFELPPVEHDVVAQINQLVETTFSGEIIMDLNLVLVLISIMEKVKHEQKLKIGNEIFQLIIIVSG